MATSIPIANLGELPAAAKAFLKLIGERPVVAFSGELGAGKTTLIQGICRELGVEADVTSPTFALVNEYFTPVGESVFHFDLYRIESPEELFDMGYEEYFFSGSRCFIEWPEKALRLIPEEAVQVQINVLEDGSRELAVELPAPQA